MNLFRTLNADEIESFRQWARDNDTPAHRAKGDLYHPEVRAEWRRLDVDKAEGRA